MRPFALLFAVLVVLSGCAAAQAPRPAVASVRDDGGRYAAALAEAFNNYESDVRTASALTYASEAEAVAVARTLSAPRLDFELRQALGRRNLTLSGFAGYAQTHSEFFHSQQRLHWGRMDQIQKTVDSLALRVEPADETLASLSTELAK